MHNLKEYTITLAKQIITKGGYYIPALDFEIHSSKS